MKEAQNSKFKIQKYKLKFKTFYFLIAILTFTFLLLTSPLHAADSTPSAGIRQKLKALQDDIASRAGQLKQDVSKKLQNKAYSGTVKTTSSSSITISTTLGDKTVTLNELTEYLWKGKASSLKSLAAGNFITAVGDLDEKETLIAKRVVRTEPLPEKEFLSGKVSSIGAGKVTLQTKDKKSLTLITDKNTDFQTAREKMLSFKDIKVNQTVIAVGIKSSEIIQAQLIFLPKTKLSTPSAVPASSSAKKQ